MEPFIGMVVRTDGPQVTVRDGQGQDWRCILRGRLRRELVGATNPVAVGDRVEVKAVGVVDGVVERLLPRRSRLARRAAGPEPREQVLAANLDLGVIVVSAPPRPTVIDRFLALVTKGGCEALVCVNKIDLTDPLTVDHAVESYRLAAIPVLLTSAVTGEGLDGLRAALMGKLVAFIGPSGAGKSSLLNAIDPSLQLRIGGLAASGRGTHTTSWATTVQIGDAMVVDTPGLREVGFLGDEAAEAAGDLFPEISALAAGCHFRDCSHTHEPKCAVKESLAAGELDEGLYKRYARLARSGRL
ncbi:MAG TPA: ribosome small subunit-dependent GTPase A [bacterium]|jgi:ribosome biogenesis GTPase